MHAHDEARACRTRTAGRAPGGTPPAPDRSEPSAGPMPSMVVTSAPSACTANIRHDRTGLAVDEDRARAAHAVLAPEVRAGEPAVLAQVVGERLARLGRPRVRLAVDGELDGVLSHDAPPQALGRGRCTDEVGADVLAGTRPTRGRRRWGRCRPRRGGRSPRGRPVVAAVPTSACSACVRAQRRGPHAEEARWPARASRCRRRRPRPRRPTPASAKSPLRRATSSTAKPARPGHDGEVHRDRGSRRRRRSWSTCRRRTRTPGRVRVPLGAGDLELGVERERDRRQLRRRIGVRDRAADRAPVADLEVPDERHGLARAAAPRRRRRRRARPRAGVVIAPTASVPFVARDAVAARRPG